MKNGLELDAPLNADFSKALAFAVRILAVALSAWLVITAIRWW
ncbi:hypothetical protein [Achromobacter sp. 413638]